MKHGWIFFLIISFLCSGCARKGTTQKMIYRVTVSGVCLDCPVVIRELPVWAQSAVVQVGDREITSQLDSSLNELAFVCHISGSQEFRVTYSSKPASKNYPARVHAQMWLKNADGTLHAVDTVATDRNDMYHKLHHHGPAFESDVAAYRIYFDDRQTVDSYGKRHAQLELAKTMWYPTEEQLANGFGCDNLRVRESVGVGTLKGWDAERGQMTHITDYRRREARIIAKGPVRAVVEMRVEGWRYCGREISMTSRYILYARHGDMQVENTIEGDFEGLVFATGIVRMAENKVLKNKEVITSLGSDLPEDDSPRRERVGLVIAVPAAQIISQTDDETSYLYQLRPNDRGRIDYTAEMVWRRSDWQLEITDDQCLVELLNSAHRARREVIVSRIQ